MELRTDTIASHNTNTNTRWDRKKNNDKSCRTTVKTNQLLPSHAITLYLCCQPSILLQITTTRTCNNFSNQFLSFLLHHFLHLLRF